MGELLIKKKVREETRGVGRKGGTRSVDRGVIIFDTTAKRGRKTIAPVGRDPERGL